MGLTILSSKIVINADKVITSVTVELEFVIEETITDTVDATGGEVELSTESGTVASVSFPDGALTSSTEASITSITEVNAATSAPIPYGLNVVGGLVYDLEARANGQAITTFNQPVTLTFTYTDDQISGLDENTLRVYWWDETEEEWVSLSDYTLDTANNSISAITTHFTLFAIMASSAPPPPSGGGGVYVPPPPATKVVLQGKAYPNVSVTVLKDGQAAASVNTDSQGNFKVEFTGLAAGTYTFGVWAGDKNGVKSVISNFTANVSSGMVTTISNILLPPTISLEKTTIIRGEILNIFGFSTPGSEIEIYIDSETKQKTAVNTKGAWLFAIDSSFLDEGSHSAKARALISEQKSIFSNIKSFNVSAVTPLPPVAPPIEEKFVTADINKDGKISMIDFTILLYNWGTPKNPATDFNSDGKVDMREVSIMMHYWTG